jgi:hypothetical protein
LTVRAYSPHGRVRLEQRWRKATAGALVRRATTIVKAMEAIVPALVQRHEEAEKRAAVERASWEEECGEGERQEQLRRRAEAIKASRQQLLAIVGRLVTRLQHRALLRGCGTSGVDAASRGRRHGPQSSQPSAAVLGETNALDRFHEWKSPDERE